MLSKIPEERLSCSELLAKTHEWTVDTNIVISDEYYAEFISLSENSEKLEILKNIIELKSNLVQFDLKNVMNLRRLKTISMNIRLSKIYSSNSTFQWSEALFKICLPYKPKSD